LEYKKETTEKRVNKKGETTVGFFVKAIRKRILVNNLVKMNIRDCDSFLLFQIYHDDEKEHVLIIIKRNQQEKGKRKSAQ